MKVLDLFCGAGGAAAGYAQAGHTVAGIDSNPLLEADYRASGAHGFKCMDALEAIAAIGDVDFYHASPPCQRYSRMSNCRPGVAAEYPDLIGPVREALDAAGKPYVIENVPGSPLRNPVVLCGFMFGREMYRHRWFEAGGGFALAVPPMPPTGLPGPRKDCGWPHPAKTSRAGHWVPGTFVSVSGHERRGPVNSAMGIHWMTRREDVAEAIPPCMTAWIGGQLKTSPAPDRG